MVPRCSIRSRSDPLIKLAECGSASASASGAAVGSRSASTSVESTTSSFSAPRSPSGAPRADFGRHPVAHGAARRRRSPLGMHLLDGFCTRRTPCRTRDNTGSGNSRTSIARPESLPRRGGRAIGLAPYGAREVAGRVTHPVLTRGFADR